MATCRKFGRVDVAELKLRLVKKLGRQRADRSCRGRTNAGPEKLNTRCVFFILEDGNFAFQFPNSSALVFSNSTQAVPLSSTKFLSAAQLVPSEPQRHWYIEQANSTEQ